ncbi:hypothetical protein QYM36_019394 [Artemia franciscana]|uniref:Solute carrier family 25 member 35 n=1 Tax=Artemia franciscana TaxID=6661 RepID=A0AA88H1A5_ARTSF|nr:hypothetical protein QYM36_019394 [Artemia franciscana]
MEFLTGGVSACGACLFTNPLEVVKIRMQLQGELASQGVYQIHYKNPFHAIFQIAKVEGILALQKGLVPALWYQLCMNGSRLGTFHFFEDKGFVRRPDGTASPAKTILAGLVAGCVGAFFGSPLYLVKTQLQSHSNASIAVGYQHDHNGMRDAVSSIYKQHGIKGLWRGSLSSLPRVSVGSASQLLTFTKSREYIHELKIFPHDSWLNILASSFLSGIAVVLLMTPFDVISTRIYNQEQKFTGNMGVKIPFMEGTSTMPSRSFEH